MKRCPFIDPTFEWDIDAPCPVCGQLGGLTEEDACVATPAEVAKIIATPAVDGATVGGEK